MLEAKYPGGAHIQVVEIGKIGEVVTKGLKSDMFRSVLEFLCQGAEHLFE